MSDFHETALLTYEKEQDQLYQEQKEKEENPTFSWHVAQKNPISGETWEDWCSTEKEAKEMVNKAIKDGNEVEWDKYAEGESPA